MKNFLIIPLLFVFLVVPVNVFSQKDSTMILQDSASEALIKCPVCDYKNKSKNIYCQVCGVLLRSEEKRDSLKSTFSAQNILKNDTAYKKKEKYIGFKIYTPMEKEVFMQCGNPLPWAYGVGGIISFEKLNERRMGWGSDVGYYFTSNNVIVTVYNSATGNILGYVNAEYGYYGMKTNTYYKWKGMRMPFWVSVGLPVWVGEFFASIEELKTYEDLCIVGVGGDISVGADINPKNKVFLSPELKVQLIPSFFSEEGKFHRTFLLSIQMLLGLNFKF
ncbi:MAG: hypothetical protein PHX21_07360 [bacterium]|nr:hypothetical protein [bacterium]